MITRYQHDHVTWVDLHAPTESDIEEVTKEFELESLIANELRAPTGRTKIEKHRNYLYTVLHFPGPSGTKDSHQEIDLILGKDFLITAHYEHIDALFEFSKLFETQMMKGKHTSRLHAGYLFYTLVLHLYRTLEDRVTYLLEDIENAEQGIFGGEERAMVQELSSLSRRILNYRLALKPHGEIWRLFQEHHITIFGKDFSTHATGLGAAHLKIWNLLEGGREAISSLRETNDSLLTAKTNDTLVHLSMMAFVVFPLTLIAGIFGMNSSNLPFIGHPLDFWIILGIMAIAVVLMFAFFRHRKWL